MYLQSKQNEFLNWKSNFDMDWRTIPSLHALRAFDAVARASSFSGAARELNVTEAAIRQHVRGLEGRLATKLVKRHGNSLELTSKGRALAETTAQSFQTLARGVHALADSDENRPVGIALPPSFAEIWLMPKLEEFWREHPGIDVSLTPSLSLADPSKEPFDLAIRYGTGRWSGVEATRLASAEYVVVAKPGLVVGTATRDLALLSDYPWLFETTRHEHRDWAERHGLDFDASDNRHYPTNSLVIAAARAGHGLSLQSRSLVQTDLKLGSFEELYAEECTPLAYYLLSDRDLRAKAKILADWLLSRCE
ncbi:MAG: LysR substrate-binding domain-containing protein [Pseudomonadota bacterium]